jgi:hypothetical protein
MRRLRFRHGRGYGLVYPFVCREHRLASTSPMGSAGPGLHVVASVLFLLGAAAKRSRRLFERKRPMRPQGHSADRHASSRHRWVVECYLRYTLIRSLGFTNNATLIQRITAYTGITSCQALETLGPGTDPGLVIETVIHVVENDQGGDPEFGTPDGLGFGEVSEAFVLDTRMPTASI